MENLVIERASAANGDALAVEIVERKGIGHPDTICDGVAEAVSDSLRRYFVSEFGRVFHYNVDKVLLRAGISHPEYGGGRIDAPIEIYIGGRATTAASGRSVPLTDICETAAKSWLRSNLKYVDAERDVRIINLIRPGSENLAILLDRDGRENAPRSNDTSIGVGFSPLSRLERAVLEADRMLVESGKSGEMPFIGEDVKIMAVRNREEVKITLACAMVGRFIRNAADYSAKKEALGESLRRRLERFGFSRVEVIVNAADDLAAGSVYLTVTGTSAEAGDDGEVGRGNRANGLITPCRTMTTEAYAGKNPVNHTGRIYQFWAQAVADRLCGVDGISSAECMMVSRIGALITEPQIISVRLATGSGREPAEAAGTCERVVAEVMAQG